MKPVLQEFIPGQADQVVSLLRQASRRWAALGSVLHLDDFWKWKHQDGPLGPSLISVAVAGNEAVGCNHSIPSRLKIGHRLRFCCYTCDAAVRPDYRRRGLLYRLVDHSNGLRKTAGMEFDYFITFNPVLKKPYSRDYPSLPLDCTAFLTVRDLRLHLRRGLSRNRWVSFFGYAFLASKNSMVNMRTGKIEAGEKYGISKISRFDQWTDDFFKAAGSPFTVIGERTSRFLNWRFCDPRGGDFIAKAAVLNGKMIAYVAAKTERLNPEYPRGYIADILALPGRTDAAEVLIRDVVEQLHRSGVNAIRCMLPKSSPYATVLRRCGFVDTRQKQPVFVAFLGDCRLDLQRIALDPPGSHHFTYADLDIV